MLGFIKVIIIKNKNNIIIGFSCGHSTRKLFLSIDYRSNWKLEVLAFEKGGKPESPEQNPRSKDENQQQSHSKGTRWFRTHGRFALSRFVTHTFIKILHALARKQMSINAYDKSVKYKHNSFVCTCDLFKKSDLINA